ncbi:MAG: hypothetical protein KatS3mg104_2482 [Phycisphaerae bacterium]|jgi:hypothetical protein|nr:MAG: hypothetical protein KatS3mg104_2482 [Phycisphaerae bacterium]
MRISTVCLFIVFVGLAGCEPYQPPTPTTRTINPRQLSGQWRMVSSLGYIGILSIYPDGTCTYRPTEASDPVQGIWTLNKSDFQATCGSLSVNGYLVDRPESPIGILIFGGDGELGQYAAWDYLGPVTPFGS